ncbi:MAG: 2Fe-2S iron-sulfur cluster-binding protein [Steroidobacteraceae bacterium]
MSTQPKRGVRVRLQVDGQSVEVPAGANVAAAVACVTPWFHRSPTGARRGPSCGMGVCFECRVRIDEIADQRACMVLACDGMRVDTDG